MLVFVLEYVLLMNFFFPSANPFFSHSPLVRQSLPTLFGPLSHDLTSYSYLALRLRLGLGIRDAWYVNLRTNDMPPTDLWQHRLYFRGDLQSDYEEIRVCPFCLVPTLKPYGHLDSIREFHIHPPGGALRRERRRVPPR